ncbi:peroxisome proliferator-activated receptor gamma coactivator-related protein 1 [Trichomycterus rosablanca]|uniref:peroxisome proliferator-activated receptor gamma coactivator-related protein 1 n=1 Tax=Trichomycterus rosablanca TaxID=2290929 RepID=UPI002F353D2F
MAARWGTGEEMLTACKMEYFSTSALEDVDLLQEGPCGLQHNGLDNGDAFGCLQSSILSIFDGSPTGLIKSGADDENEATLLTALTEILDNVDDENLSPFDTLPDVELLQGEKDNEHLSIDDDNADFPELIEGLDVSSELDWCLPISLEQDGETVSVTLSDLVKHMNPYTMTLCVEGEEQLLPEGGIILEVMDKGEHGEPILSIPDLSFPLSLSSAEGEQCVPESSPEKVEFEGKRAEATPSSEVSPVKENRDTDVNKQPKNESSKRLSSKRKKKRKTEAHPAEKRVLRSEASKKVEESGKEPEDEQKKMKNVSFSSACALNEVCQTANLSEDKAPEVQAPVASLSSSLTPHTTSDQAAVESKPSPVPEDKVSSGALPETPVEIDDSCKEEHSASQSSEPKTKSLSLQQYRLLRQQKKPTPLDKPESSTKWPTLPEAPKELPPIPYLPDPSPKDPRHAGPKQEPAPEIMPAWQPRGPGAPPTPEALLVPPASLLASRKPACSKPVSSIPPSKPAENVATSTSPSTLPTPQKLPTPTDVPLNTISKENHAAKPLPAESTVSLPVAATNAAPQNLPPAEMVKCLQNTPSVSKVTTAFFKNKEVSKPQNVSAPATVTTTTVQKIKAALNTLNAAMPLRKVLEQNVAVLVPELAKAIHTTNTNRPPVSSQRHVAPIAAQPFSSAPVQARIMKLAEQMRKASTQVVGKPKSPTEKLIESFTSEIGIEAADLASLLEQFEEAQPKKQSVLEVCGRAAAVGNSSVEQQAENNGFKKVASPDLASTAGLTPPATPPHQMWKPLAPVALLGKQAKSESAKPSPTKTIQIDPLPLPANKLQSKPQTCFTPGQVQPVALDHDYCFVPKEPTQNEMGNRWNAKQQPSIIIKSVVPPNNCKASQQSVSELPSITENSLLKNDKSQQSVCKSQSERQPQTSTGLVTPDASPDRLNSKRLQGYSERSPSPYNHKRGRSQRKYRTRLPSPSGSTSSSSRSRSPPRKRYRSRSTSRSPSRYDSRSWSRSSSRSSSPRQRRYSYSSSRSWSRSRSRSMSRSQSPARRPRHRDTHDSPSWRTSYCYESRCNNEENRKHKDKAIEERRVVYIGRIHGGMTRKELRERFSCFGEIEECTVHFREHGDNYGFVTYYNTRDAFNAIENGGRLRQLNELPFDLCFGGRRQFCKTSYADLDSNRDFDPLKARFDALDFDTLLKQAQKNLKR